RCCAAIATDEVPALPMTHPHLHWTLDPGPLAAMAVGSVIYVRRFRAARQEAGGRGAGWLHVAAFAGCIVVLLAALVSPLDGLGENYLFSAHMAQHVLLGDIAPLDRKSTRLNSSHVAIS